MKNTSLLFLALVCIAGCADPFIGKWEATEDSTVDFNIREANGGYEGDGHVYFCVDVDCILCPFDLDATETGDARYEMDCRFTGQCDAAGNMKGIDCRLMNDDQRLECTFPGDVEIKYDKVE